MAVNSPSGVFDDGADGEGHSGLVGPVVYDMDVLRPGIRVADESVEGGV